MWRCNCGIRNWKWAFYGTTRLGWTLSQKFPWLSLMGFYSISASFVFFEKEMFRNFVKISIFWQILYILNYFLCFKLLLWFVFSRIHFFWIFNFSYFCQFLRFSKFHLFNFLFIILWPGFCDFISDFYFLKLFLYVFIFSDFHSFFSNFHVLIFFRAFNKT